MQGECFITLWSFLVIVWYSIVILKAFNTLLSDLRSCGFHCMPARMIDWASSLGAVDTLMPTAFSHADFLGSTENSHGI